MRTTVHSAWILGVSSFCLRGVQAADLTYRVVDLGVLQNLEQPAISEAEAVNDRDQVTGWSRGDSSTTAKRHPFRWDRGEMIDLGTNGWDEIGLDVMGRGINEFGHVAGDASTQSGGADWRGFFWTPESGLIDLAFGGRGIAIFAINNHDQIAYSGGTLSGEQLIGYWENGIFYTVEPLPPYTSGLVLDINDHGNMVGYSALALATIWVAGRPYPIADLGGSESYGDEINEINQVCGTSETENADEFGVYRWSAGQIEDLNSNGDQRVGIRQTALNNAGEVIALSDHRFVILRDGQEYAIQDALDGQSVDWQIADLNDINDAGRIVGSADSPSTSGIHAVMLIPNEFRVAGPIPGLAGRENVLRAVGAEPNKRVYFVYGFAAGNGEVPGCPGLFVDIAQPILAGVADADAEGEALLSRNVPASAAGAKIIFQAVQRNSCQVARPVWHRFPE